MSCPHATALSPQVNACSLNRYGGRPSVGVCRGCIERGENTADHTPPPAAPAAALPSFGQMAKGLVSSIKQEVVARATQQPAVEPQEIERRMSLCGACEHFIKSSSRCAKCGCFMAFKSRLRSAHCPVGKW